MKSPGEKSVLIAIIGAVSAVVAAVAAPICATLLSSDAPPAATSAAGEGGKDEPPVTPGPPIEGVWRQWVYDETGAPVEIGDFVVTCRRGEYFISARRQAEGERIMNSIGIYDVAYTGKLLTFISNWGGGEVGAFHLERQTDAVFEGEIRVAGQVPNRTKLVKIE